MWNLLPDDIQGEILSRVHVSVWYRLMKTCRGGMNAFPGASIWRMNVCHNDTSVSLRMMLEISMDMLLPNIKTVIFPAPDKRDDFAYSIKNFVKTFPNARLVFSGHMTLAYFEKYATGRLSPVHMKWVGLADHLDVTIRQWETRYLDDERLSIRASRLLAGGYSLCLTTEADAPFNYFESAPLFWNAIFAKASKIEIRDRCTNGTFLWTDGYPVAILADYALSHATDPAMYCIALPSLRQGCGIQDLDPRYIQSPYILCEDAAGVAEFLAHRAIFDAQRVAPIFLPQTMALLPPDMWCHLFSMGLFVPNLIYKIVYTFLFHMDDAWCNDDQVLDNVARRLVDAMLHCQVHVPEKKLLRGLFICRSLQMRLKPLLCHAQRRASEVRQRTWVGVKCKAILDHFGSLLPSTSSFFKEILAPPTLSWPAVQTEPLLPLLGPIPPF